MMDTYRSSERDIRRLLAHVMLTAIEDHSKPNAREAAQAFFDSEQLDWIADELGLTAWRIRRRVSEGFDPKKVGEWTKYLRRAHKGKNGGVFAERAETILNTEA